MSKLLILLFIISCSSVKVTNEIYQPEFDLLKAESFDRYTQERILSYQGNNQLNKGLLLCYQSKFENGIDYFKSILVENVNNSLYWNSIALCNQLKSEYQKAIFYLGIAKSHAKTNHELAIINNNIGVILLNFNKNFEAQNKFEESIKQSNNLLTPRLNIARLYLQYGLFTKALKELHFLHKINTDDIDVNALLGKAYLLQGNAKRGHFYLTKIPKTYLKRHELANVYAATLAQLGQFNEAKAVLDNIENSNVRILSSATSDLYTFINTEGK